MVLAGIELVCFLVADVGLCFGFSVRTMLIIPWCFSCCQVMFISSQGLFSRKGADAQEAGRDHSWTKLAKEILLTLTHHTQYINWSWLVGKDQLLGNWPVMGVTVGEQLHHLFCGFHCCCCYFLCLWCHIELFLSQHTSFLLHCPPTTWQLGRMSEWLCGPICHLRLNHNQNTKSCYRRNCMIF